MTASSRVHWWTTLALAGVGSLLLAVFLGPRRSLPVMPRAAGDGNVLRIACIQRLMPDPHVRTFPLPAQNQFILGLWEPLIECDPETGQPRPAAAESWEWSEDRLVLTLKLRADGRWSNGEPVKAQDFVRGWRRLLHQSMELASTLFPLKNAEAFYRGQVTDPAKVGVTAVDDRTLRLTLAGVRSTLVSELADPLLAPMHESTAAVLKEQGFWRHPEKLLGNGAFSLERAGPEGFRLRASPHYHDRAAVRLAGAEFMFGTMDGSVVLLDRHTQTETLRVHTGGGVVTTPVVAGGKLVVGSRDYLLYGFNLGDGTVAWKYSYWFSWIESTPVLRDGLLYVGASDYSRVVALDPATGRAHWVTEVHGMNWGSPLATAERVFTGTVSQNIEGTLIAHQGGLVALDRRTGEVLWQLVSPPGPKDGFGGYAGSLALAGDKVIAAGFDGMLVAVSAN